MQSHSWPLKIFSLGLTPLKYLKRAARENYYPKSLMPILLLLQDVKTLMCLFFFLSWFTHIILRINNCRKLFRWLHCSETAWGGTIHWPFRCRWITPALTSDHFLLHCLEVGKTWHFKEIFLCLTPFIPKEDPKRIFQPLQKLFSFNLSHVLWEASVLLS